MKIVWLCSICAQIARLSPSERREEFAYREGDKHRSKRIYSDAAVAAVEALGDHFAPMEKFQSELIETPNSPHTFELGPTPPEIRKCAACGDNGGVTRYKLAAFEKEEIYLLSSSVSVSRAGETASRTGAAQ